ncbi:hypothetical protein GH714_001233 [Hevea brasiliensis]|uniref:Thiaminase-2/PQQC domain-containing protein n=1 Tax=Hevea brasiliensis TaxID=3981 RepID=A0A6A6KHA1_HEVBR|nr:hypothetical protein GH714_001233 [Hevea brasiliensis]
MAIPPKLVSSSSSSFPTTARGSSEEGLANKLWIKFRRESIFAMYTPFVVCLAAGNLKIETFRHCISQDFHFLKAFAHAYKLAEECADDDAKLAITKLRKGVLEELKMHNSFVQEWGIDPSKEETINYATVRYTDFLLATASGKVEAKELQALVDSEDGSHPYKKWIDNYSSEGISSATEDLLDNLSIPLTSEELDIIEKLYHQAMKLEIEFFNVQPLSQPTVVPLTKEHNPVEDRLVIFSDFDLIHAFLTPLPFWQRLQFGVHYEVLCKALEQLSDFERKANARVVESGVLKGLNLEDIKRAGGLDVLNIHANEFSFEVSISTGEIIKKVESPRDKVQAFNNILKNYSTDRKNLTVYIGDSVGDLLCLLQADIGIVIGSSLSLRRVGNQFGVSFLPLFPGLVKKQKEYIKESSSTWKGQSGTLYTVSSWAEIHAFILGW